MLRRTERLFRRYRETGNARALGAVFDKTAPELLRVATHLTRDPHRAEDLLQSTFLSAMEKARQYDPRRPLMPWLLAILANHCRQEHRRRRPQSLPFEGTTSGDVADRAAAREFSRACDRALDGLGEPYRHVLILHLRHGLSGVEIARALDRPESTVRNRIARGMQMLRRALPAGIGSGAVLVASGGRGLAAVRAAVLERAPSATAAAVAGTLSFTGVLLMMSKKLVVSVVLAATLVAGGVHYSGVLEAPPPSEPRPHANAEAAERGDPEVARGSRAVAEPREVRRAPPPSTASQGWLLGEVVVRGEETPVAGVPYLVWTSVEGGRGATVAEGTTAADGTLHAAGLTPGGYLLELPGRLWEEEFEVTAGQATRQRIAIERGWRLEGTVVDGHGRPVAGAEVRGKGNPDSYLLATSAGDGTFAADWLRGGVDVWAVAAGHRPSARQGVAQRSPSASIRLVIEPPATRMSGLVEDERGLPVPRARVYLGLDLHAGSYFVQRELHDLRAGDDGTFAADWLPQGSLFVGALPADRDPARATGRWLTLTGHGNAGIVLRLGDGATVTGQARDDRGRPLAGVQVSSWLRSEIGLGPFDRRRAATDEGGRFVLPGLLPGVHGITARRGEIQVEAEMDLGRRKVRTWDPLLGEGGSISVRMLDPAGDPLSGWRIELRSEETRGFGSVQRTGEDGRCTFGDLRPVAYEVRALVEGYAVCAASKGNVFPGTGEVELRVAADRMPSARIRGRLVDGRGEPVRGARASLSQSGTDSHGGLPLRVDREGRFATGLLPPGGYGLFVQAPDKSGAGGFYELRPDQDLDVGDLVLEESAALAVRLRSEDGAPVRGAVLRVGTVNDVHPGTEDLEPDPVDGIYRAIGLDPGSHVLRFFAADAAPRMVPVGLGEGETRELDLVVTRAIPVVLELRCRLDEQEAGGMLNGMLTLHDAAGERVVFHRLWGYFDDFDNRIERIELALAPGGYRVACKEFGGAERELELQVPATGLDEPFVIDLR